MIEHEPMDQTTLNIMEVYRRQVTDLKEQLYNAEQNASSQECLRNNAERKSKEAEDRLDFARKKHDQERAEYEKKITKLEDSIESLKIELQDERAAHTKTKEGSDDR